MTRNQKRAHRIDILTSVSSEILSHMGNGSGWLYEDQEGNQLPDDIAQYRESILKQIAATLDARAARMLGPKR